MKNKDLFNKTIQKLVKAFIEGKLIPGVCSACVVGNICNGSLDWALVFITSSSGQKITPENYIGKSKEVIDATGYTWQELARIEKTFESTTKLKGGTISIISDYDTYTKEEIMEDQFNGLMAVVDVLMDIHECKDEDVKKETKAMFVK